MLTEVRVCGRKLFYPHMWRVLINGKKWWYLEKPEMFVDEHGYVTPKKGLPIPVHLGFLLAWENNKLMLHERYSHRRSYAWKLLIGTLQREGRNIVVFSRGRRMGLVTLVDESDIPPKKIPILPVLE